MLKSRSEIDAIYLEGIKYLTNVTYNKFAKELYGLQYKRTDIDDRLLLLLMAVESWDNRVGATNIISEHQLLSVMQNIAKCGGDWLASLVLSVEKTQCGQNETLPPGNGTGISPTIAILDTSTIDLSLINNVLSALVKISGQSGNQLALKADGLFSAAVGESQEVYFITAADFSSNTQYENSILAGKDLLIWHRGLGFLTYNKNVPSDPGNEFQVLLTGGFNITIPGFNVNDGINNFYIIVTNYATTTSNP